MASRTRSEKLLGDLGLLGEEAPPTNPLLELGLDQNAVKELLELDKKGAIVRALAKGATRSLSGFYHPDSPDKKPSTTDPERFDRIRTANASIEKASPDELYSWAVADRPTPSAHTSRQLEQGTAIIRKAASDIAVTSMELGHDPRHFSQFQWTQGMLLYNNQATLLMRSQPNGVEVLRGERMVDGAGDSGKRAPNSFANFLKRHKYFGLEPGSSIASYIDEHGRASILERDLSFVMDISGPLQKYRSYRATPEQKSNAWAHRDCPIFMTTKIPRATTPTPETQITAFPDSVEERSTAWDMPFTVGGSFTNKNFFNRVRHRRNVGATAISGARVPRVSYFSAMAVNFEEMITHEAEYSPLLLPGDSLTLYDPQNRTPLVTNASILGMLGNGAQGA